MPRIQRRVDAKDAKARLAPARYIRADLIATLEFGHEPIYIGSPSRFLWGEPLGPRLRAVRSLCVPIGSSPPDPPDEADRGRGRRIARHADLPARRRSACPARSDPPRRTRQRGPLRDA